MQVYQKNIQKVITALCIIISSTILTVSYTHLDVYKRQVLHNSGFNVQENGTSKSRINNNGFVNFVNGTLTTASVTKNGNGSDVTFNVNTTTIETDGDGNATAENPSNLATAGDVTSAINKVRNMPLTFAGDTGKDVERKLGQKVNLVGGETDATKLSDGNIGRCV